MSGGNWFSLRDQDGNTVGAAYVPQEIGGDKPLDLAVAGMDLTPEEMREQGVSMIPDVQIQQGES